ncbi:MAG TPA: gamma-glutamyl-gamma-aminobutyrate hydrolase family protein [Solirubrobacteraceae bacterium]|nr:gamma-glutamyl-gamma-aminobutyrate hydrolase family protein [Solirubrobacteraceae bacterium]
MPTIAVLGDRDPRFVTHRELDAELARMPAGTEAAWLHSPRAAEAAAADAIWVAPGTPYEDDDAVLAALDRAIEDGTPLLGTCGGFQYLAIALARRAGLPAANADADPGAEDPLVAPLACSLVGEEREVTCVPGTRLAAICGTAPFTGFHFCNFGLAPAHVAGLEAAGVVVAAHAPDAGVEGIELPGHPFLLATLFQPQVGALAGRPRHPLVAAFTAAASRDDGDRRGSDRVGRRGDGADVDERVEAA